jgi:hypothetical protein
MRRDPARLICFAREAGDQQPAALIARRVGRAAISIAVAADTAPRALALRTLDRLVRLLGLYGDSG